MWVVCLLHDAKRSEAVAIKNNFEFIKSAAIKWVYLQTNYELSK